MPSAGIKPGPHGHIETNFCLTITRTYRRDLVASMRLWDSVMVAPVIGATIAFSCWARIRATRSDG